MAYPIIMTFSQLVGTDRYKVRVSGDARVFLAFRNGEWRCSGVEPGGLSAAGKTPQEAGSNFRLRLSEALNDFVELSPTLAEYRRDVATFLKTNTVMAGRWDAALLALRAGADVAEKSVSTLPRKLASDRTPITVVRVAEFVEGREEFHLARPEQMDEAA